MACACCLVSTVNQLLSLPTTPAAPTLTGLAKQELRSKAGLVRTLLSWFLRASCGAVRWGKNAGVRNPTRASPQTKSWPNLPLDLESTLSKGRPDPWSVPVPPPAYPSSGLARGPAQALPALTPDGSDLFQHRGPLGPGVRAVVCRGHGHASEEQLHSSIIRRREV